MYLPPLSGANTPEIATDNFLRNNHVNAFNAIFCFDLPQGGGKYSYMAPKARTFIAIGDVYDVLRAEADNSYEDGLVDPPFGLRLLGKEWDARVPPALVWKEIRRVLKPGAHLLSFGGPRTWHRLACNIEDAGFEIVDTIGWCYSNGFPKNHNIAKAIDEQLGRNRDKARSGKGGTMMGNSYNSGDHDDADCPPASTDEAARWHGYGTALKPAWQPILVARKPMDRTHATNAVTWGVAGLNIAGCAIPCAAKTKFPEGDYDNPGMLGVGSHRSADTNPSARFPANLLLSHHPDCHQLGTREINSNGHWARIKVTGYGTFGGGRSEYEGPGKRLAVELVDLYDCHPDCPIRCLNEQSRNEVSRFFYCTRASRNERHLGLGGEKNDHPCVKPIGLCTYLARLLLPPDQGSPRKLLVPYCGSGSEMIGGVLAGWDEIYGVEIDPHYVNIATKRIRYWRARPEIDSKPLDCKVTQ